MHAHAHASVFRNIKEKMARAHENVCRTNESRQSLHRVSYVMMSVTMSGLVMMGITPPVQAASFWFHLKQRKLTFIVTNYRALRFYCIDGKF